MQDFSSISVSSYEAGTLAERLTERSNEGWSVVAIVPTGSTVTAYLSRPSDAGSAASDAEATAEHHEPERVSVDDIVADEIAVAEVAVADVAEQSGHDSGATEIMPQEVVRETTDGVGWAASATGSSADIAPEITPSTAEASAAVTEPVAQAEPAGTAPEVAAAAASAGAAPAGWYADPSSRFELRYWDGSQWTEHVSRAGQQYTDPPVA